MSAVYNPQADLMAEIERLEAEARDLRRRLEQTQSPTDKVVLKEQLDETKSDIARMQARLS